MLSLSVDASPVTVFRSRVIVFIYSVHSRLVTIVSYSAHARPVPVVVSCSVDASPTAAVSIEQQNNNNSPNIISTAAREAINSTAVVHTWQVPCPGTNITVLYSILKTNIYVQALFTINKIC